MKFLIFLRNLLMRPQKIANSMNKTFPIIIGSLIGATMAAGMIVHNGHTAYGEDEETPKEAEKTWVDAVASGNAFEWQDIFTPSSKGKGLYGLVYEKLLVSPQKDALADVAQGYGLTKDEAQAVVNGSITPIFNNPDRKSFKLTKEDAIKAAAALKEEFEFYQELYDIQMELDVAVKSSEMFANGDLNDSGFDLVHDLSIIEEILFQERTETTVGQPFDKALDSPYLPPDPSLTNEGNIYDPGVSDIYNLNFDKSDIIGDSAKTDNNDTEVIKAALEIGDTDVEVTLLEEDICPPDNKYADALGILDDKNLDSLGQSGDGNNNGTPGLGDGDGDGGDGESGSPNALGDLGTPEDLEDKLDVPADEWLKSWCPALEGDSSSPGAYGKAGFASLSGSGESVKEIINKANLSNAVDSAKKIANKANISTGAGAGYSSDQISAQIAICLNIELVWKKVSSYQPGDSCVMCEIEHINTAMGKTLDHTLSPNKATGNLMESAKCKDGYGEFIDMQFITIARPIPTPPNDDVVFGRNITEEWNKFITDYQPEKFSKLTIDGNPDNTFDTQLERASATITPGTTVLALVDKIALDKAKQEAAAKAKMDEIADSSDSKNIIVYAQTVLQNLKQMNAYFKGYNKLYDDIGTDVCPKILAKPST